MDLDEIFKAYDIRGKVGEVLNSELTFELGKAFGHWLPEDGPVAVGRDMRPDSAELADALIHGLSVQGREVWDLGQITSDMIYFAVGSNKLAGGAMITASHNPGAYNGIKLCREMALPIGIETGLEELKKLIEDGGLAPHETDGLVEKHDIADAWIEHALSFVDVESLKPYSIAIDAGNGMAGAIIPRLESKVPFKVHELYFELDGTFPNHEANPLKIDNLSDLIKDGAADRHDFGIAFDGDGDRAFLVDEKGGVLNGSVTTAILARHLLKKHSNATILYNAVCSRIVPETIAKYGGSSIRTKVGHSYIKAKMHAHQALFAGEHSGHYYFKDNYSADSGLIAALMMIDVLSETDLTLSELAKEFRVYANSQEINLEVDDKVAMIKRVASKFADGEQDELDGLTVRYDDWWFNLRPSNTEQLLRLNVEAKNQDLVEQKVDEIQKIITLPA